MPKNKGTFALTEKPKIKFNVNVGTYVINKDILKQIKSKKYLDFRSLIDLSAKNKKNWSVRNKDKDWIDVGQMDKYKYFQIKNINFHTISK